MEWLDDVGGESSGQNIKQDEINGQQHTFHSYPKEFQAWHNTQFMLEKKAPIDISTISESALNGMMWQAISDGTKFGLTSFIAIAFAIIKLKLAPNLFGLTISFLVFFPWLIYSVYHFVFYAKIRAQVVGPVTKSAFEYTARIFYETYFSIVISMTIALLFIFGILDDIALLLRDTIVGLEPGNVFDGYLKSALTSIYNFSVDLLTGPEDLLGMFLFNTYFLVFLFLGMMLGLTYLFEKRMFEKREEIVEIELVNEKNLTGYPIENALRKLHAWRKENGV